MFLSVFEPKERSNSYFRYILLPSPGVLNAVVVVSKYVGNTMCFFLAREFFLSNNYFLNVSQMATYIKLKLYSVKWCFYLNFNWEILKVLWIFIKGSFSIAISYYYIETYALPDLISWEIGSCHLLRFIIASLTEPRTKTSACTHRLITNFLSNTFLLSKSLKIYSKWNERITKRLYS